MHTGPVVALLARIGLPTRRHYEYRKPREDVYPNVFYPNVFYDLGYIDGINVS
jgi:hypothetical protein